MNVTEESMKEELASVKRELAERIEAHNVMVDGLNAELNTVKVERGRAGYSSTTSHFGY